VNAADPDGDTPLILAVDDANYDVVAMLVGRGADVNAGNKAGDTPLTNAACWGSRRVVDLLYGSYLTRARRTFALFAEGWHALLHEADAA
jgi:ankyrin repeat protein